MPVTPTYPGIYIQELPSSTHTITAAPTNIAVFIGCPHPFKAPQSVWGKAVQIFGFQDYERFYGGFMRSAAYAAAADELGAAWQFADLAAAVNQFFLNGGSQAYVVAVMPQAVQNLATVTLSSYSLPSGGTDAVLTGTSVQIGGIVFTAREITDETYSLTATVRPNPPPGGGLSPPPASTADIILTYGPSAAPTSGQVAPGTVTETYRRVSLTQFLADGVTPDPNYILTRIGVLGSPVSNLVTASFGSPPGFPASAITEPFPTSVPKATELFAASDFTAVMAQDSNLDKLAIFNLMVLPGVTNPAVMSTALAFCESKRAFLILDPPLTDSADGTLLQYPHTIQQTMSAGLIAQGTNSALYFPYLASPDPLTGLAQNPVTGKTNEIPPAPTVAGIFASTDVSRGVWKAPAGFQATTINTTGVVERGQMTDQRQGVLNPLGINCLRDFPNIGTAVFGARTTVTLTDEQWRYVPVRRMALFLEQTFYANLGWVVFEPNAEPLWSAITMTVTSFMLGLFRQGAFAGTKPSEAFSVQCNSQTTTPDDVNNGIVNIVVAFAPLKPAEFVIIKIAQLAGQTQTS